MKTCRLLLKVKAKTEQQKRSQGVATRGETEFQTKPRKSENYLLKREQIWPFRAVRGLV
jgi:hypothetical protein